MTFKASDVRVEQKVRAYQGFFKIDRYRLQHPLFEGGMGVSLTRECLERGHAVAVLPYDPVLDRVVLIEQFRIGAYAAGQDPWLLELVAGIIEDGEAVMQVAHREAGEEAGLTLQEMAPICHYLVSPGGTSESTHLYCARVDSQQASGVHGLDEEGEDIKVHAVSYQQAIDWLSRGIINNGSTIIALQWLQLNRDTLREKWLD